MKKWKILLFSSILASTLTLCGCGDTELSSAKITRDDARTGGTLSFVYDQVERVVTIGGEDEVVQYSAENEEKNLGAGCRIGLKVTAPDENLDFSTATLEMNGVNYSDFMESENGQEQRFFNIYPLFTSKDKQTTFTVKWSDGTKAQKYEIEIADGTKFMTANGTVEEAEEE